jgi:integrase
MLSEVVNRHIELYRSVGFKYKVQAYMLHSFADFAQGRSEEFVQTDSVLEWAASAPSVRQRHDRLLTIRRRACSLNAEDKRHQVPPADFFGRARKRRRTCHIFTPDEIGRLLRAASDLPPTGSMRPVTYTALLSLIVCTGLRISEALKLELSDLTEDGLLIRATKFQKNRLVPLHESARCGLRPVCRCPEPDSDNHIHRLHFPAGCRASLSDSERNVSTSGALSRSARWAGSRRLPHSGPSSYICSPVA